MESQEATHIIKEGWTLGDLRRYVQLMAEWPDDTKVKAFTKMNADLKTLKLKAEPGGPY